jgi:hypothetical protein
MREYRMFYSECSEYELCKFALDNGFDVIKAISEFCLCNIRASLGADAAKKHEIIIQNDRRLKEVFRRFEEMWYKMDKSNSRYVSGEEISKKLNLSPGSIIESILRQHDELVGIGEITSRRDALKWLENFDINYKHET